MFNINCIPINNFVINSIDQRQNKLPSSFSILLYPSRKFIIFTSLHHYFNSVYNIVSQEVVIVIVVFFFFQKNYSFCYFYFDNSCFSPIVYYELISTYCVF